MQPGGTDAKTVTRDPFDPLLVNPQIARMAGPPSQYPESPVVSANRLAPEWEPQDAIILTWPHRHSDWAPELGQIEPVYLELCKYIGKHQALILIAYDPAHVLEIRDKLDTADIDCEHMRFATIPTNDTWIRDYGPVCTTSGHSRWLLDFQFDGWGQKYDWRLDNAVNARLTEGVELRASHQYIDQILEAGNIEINGQGELLCSRTCFRRTRALADSEFAILEKQLAQWLGCRKVHWLDRVQLAGDDTGGHIDTLARFCADDIIAHSASPALKDSNHEMLERLSLQLANINRQAGNRFELVPLPLPDLITRCGQPLPATYTNFLVTNDLVLVPVFNDGQDDGALRQIDELFPDREIVDIECNALIRQRGGLHCATMQIPEGFIT